MSKVICIAGESGSGKTTSMRNLDPKTTLYIDCDKKGLSWKGWKKQYNTENKNYIKTDFVQQVFIALKKLETDWKDKKVVVIDTINGLMIADEMRRSKEKGYDKWVDLAACVWDLVCYAYELRDDLTVIFTAHILVDVSVIRFNKIGSEGLSSHTVEGESLSFAEDDFANYRTDIQAYLDTQKDAVRGKVRFL